MNLIIPAAGRSSRFPNLRPKWMLTHPSGNLMLAEAIRGLPMEQVERIYLTVLTEHLDEYQCRDGILKQFKQFNLLDKLVICELQAPTQSQPETVAETIKAHSISGAICIKDSDNFFRLPSFSGNFVSVVDLSESGMINAGNKSYASINQSGLVTNITEKRVISNTFCCGAYGFENAQEFLSFYEKLQTTKDVYISHVIYEMILENKAFAAVTCSGYVDWGTLKDWNAFKRQYGTVFVDVDGTLVRNSGEYFAPFWGETEGIIENVAAINRLFDSGKVQVILTTCRREEYREVTLRQLERAGVRYHQILFGLNHGKRVIINDYANSNPFPSCEAINHARNSPDLAAMLDSVLSPE